MSTNSANELTCVDISGLWFCPARDGKIIKITQTGAAGRCELEESGSELFTFEVKRGEGVATITSIGSGYGVTGRIGGSTANRDKVIIWSNGYVYQLANAENYVDISGSWSCPARAGVIKMTQTGSAGRCDFGSEAFLFEVEKRVVTATFTGPNPAITGNLSPDGKVIIWSSGYAYTRIECPDITVKLPNIRSTRADDLPHLWGAVDTTGVAGVPIAVLELTWIDQTWGYRKGNLHARKDGGAWVQISTDAAEHELTRESFEIPAALLGGKLELGYSVGSGGGHLLIIKDAEVEITERK